MPTMKTRISIFAFAVSGLLTLQGSAMTPVSTPGQGALFGGATRMREDRALLGNLRGLSLAFHAGQVKRDAEVDYPTLRQIRPWRERTLMGVIGYDVLSWLTLQAGAGESQLTDWRPGRDAGFKWQAGLDVRLIDYLLLDPIVGSDAYWFRLRMQAQYAQAKSKADRDTIKWNETYLALPAALTARPERQMMIKRISIFAGPAFSHIDGRIENSFGNKMADVKADQTFGFAGGIMINPSDNLCLVAEARNFGDLSYLFSLSLHF